MTQEEKLRRMEEIKKRLNDTVDKMLAASKEAENKAAPEDIPETDEAKRDDR